MSQDGKPSGAGKGTPLKATRKCSFLFGNYALKIDHLQTPHFPPCFAQWAQYLQFLQALHGSLPVQVAKEASAEIIVTTAKAATSGQTRKSRDIHVSILDAQNSTPIFRDYYR
jgi:hypothetical protein